MSPVGRRSSACAGFPRAAAALETAVQLAASYIPEDVAGGVDLAFPDTGPRDIRRRLADRGHRAVRFVEQVDARRPSGEEAEYFKLSSGQPVLHVVRFAYDAAGRALEVVSNVFPSQLWSLRHEWDADEPAEPQANLI